MRWFFLSVVLVSLSGCTGGSTPAEHPPNGFDGAGGDQQELPEEGDDPSDFGDAGTGPATPAWGGLDAPIRPGAPIGWCTYNFLFHAPGNDTYYIGTAAHCTDELGQRMPLAGFREEIGTVVYDSNNATDGEDGADFSLVRLDDGLNLQANPAMMNRDGPTGYTRADEVTYGDVVEHHGYGLGVGELEQTRDREGVFSGWYGGVEGDEYCAESPVWFGDSGSPVLHQATGTAFGIVSRAGWSGCWPAAQVMGATVEFILAELEQHGWSGVELATV